MSEQRRQIVAAVKAKEGISPKQIAADSGVDLEVAKKLVRRLVQDGLLDTDGPGHYMTVPSVSSVPHDDDPWNAGNMGNGDADPSACAQPR